MSGVMARMRTLRGRCALVRNGYGAAVLPNDVKRLSLTYAAKINDGHMGPRKFWRQYLPRLKFHNPAVEMDVVQNKGIGGSATLVVEFANRKETIECQHKHENDIVKALYEITGAKPVPVDERDSQYANDYLQETQRQMQANVAKRSRRAAKKEQELLDGPPIAT